LETSENFHTLKLFLQLRFGLLASRRDVINLYAGLLKRVEKQRLRFELMRVYAESVGSEDVLFAIICKEQSLGGAA
jgi:hypothetical protein